MCCRHKRREEEDDGGKFGEGFGCSLSTGLRNVTGHWGDVEEAGFPLSNMPLPPMHQAGVIAQMALSAPNATHTRQTMHDNAKLRKHLKRFQQIFLHLIPVFASNSCLFFGCWIKVGNCSHKFKSWLRNDGAWLSSEQIWFSSLYLWLLTKAMVWRDWWI